MYVSVHCVYNTEWKFIVTNHTQLLKWMYDDNTCYSSIVKYNYTQNNAQNVIREIKFIRARLEAYDKHAWELYYCR